MQRAQNRGGGIVNLRLRFRRIGCINGNDFRFCLRPVRRFLFWPFLFCLVLPGFRLLGTFTFRFRAMLPLALGLVLMRITTCN